MRVLLVNDTEKPIGELRQALTCAGYAAVGAGVAAYVVDGLALARLAPIVQVALARFAQESNMRKRLDDVQQALQDRKLSDRAKGLLMEKRGLSEADAYAALR
ncbi:histidine kinase/response regulator hybrid protein [Xanthomonas arboricola pv. juglandis]|nr:histidine kinase/response regulator hybrid protein [Xanthomonas arboricola pv. juglandis]SYZ60193.1 histidine kinase/response regulator hybrid protein [Xanthomonas arboricola pv. juglandis]